MSKSELMVLPPAEDTIKASDMVTNPVEAQEFASSVADNSTILQLYNRCLRCGRKIKAPQKYGRVCARKIREGVVDMVSPLQDRQG